MLQQILIYGFYIWTALNIILVCYYIFLKFNKEAGENGGYSRLSGLITFNMALIIIICFVTLLSGKVPTA